MFLLWRFFDCGHIFVFLQSYSSGRVLCLSWYVVDAVQAVKMTNAHGEVKYPIKVYRNQYIEDSWKSARDSFLMNGYALNTGRAAQGMPLRVTPAKIICLDFNL
ncbi:hypothetical protein Fmac_008712 [Flemingia macrophylla]|uniref:Uncharacterized protein n=1 Tax=Flemingia macrophylla TaxID=520843 RepID=A0ABD1MZ20_9FABA